MSDYPLRGVYVIEWKELGWIVSLLWVTIRVVFESYFWRGGAKVQILREWSLWLFLEYYTVCMNVKLFNVQAGEPGEHSVGSNSRPLISQFIFKWVMWNLVLSSTIRLKNNFNFPIIFLFVFYTFYPSFLQIVFLNGSESLKIFVCDSFNAFIGCKPLSGKFCPKTENNSASNRQYSHCQNAPLRASTLFRSNRTFFYFSWILAVWRWSAKLEQYSPVIHQFFGK